MSDKVIIFDFDGTLANSFPLVLRIANDLAVVYGYKQLNKAEIELLREKSAREVFKSLKIPFWKLPFLVGRFKSELHKQISFLKPVKGMTDVLSSLHSSGYKMAIITSNSEENVKAFLKKYSLDGCFDYLHCGGNIFGKAKFLQQFMTKRGLTASNVVYVGDEVRDIDTAHQAGVKIISVEWGYNSKKVLAENNPDVLVQQPDDLLKVIDFVL